MKFFDEKIKVRKPKKSKFDLSHERKLSFNMGELVPILVQDVMPGDSFRVSSEQMMRLAPMIAPMMHRVNTYMHFFFVPNRLVWNEWERFITGGDGNTPGDVGLPPVFPTVTVGEVTAGQGGINHFDVGSLADYMGVPTWTPPTPGVDATSPQLISALPFRAYQLIWDEYYRDQDIQQKIIALDAAIFNSGPVSGNNYALLLTMRKRAWEKDYYTSARPFAQKGGAVGIPFEYADTSYLFKTDGSPVTTAGPLNTGAADNQLRAGATSDTAHIENIERLATINEFREANALQRFLEKLARSGNRYIEYIKSIFGETSSDSRLQRPEYLGGGRAPIVISEVLSTFDNTTGGLPQGNMSGHGISVGNTNGFTQQFNEHGYIIGIISVLPRTGYQQGLPKHWSRRDQLEFPIPDFAHLGEQAVLNKELYIDYDDAVPANNEATFGYQSRYSECKFTNSTSHGDFRTTLAFWHMDRIFASRPGLNPSFIESDPTLRIFAITDPDLDHIWCMVYNHVSAVRPLPYHGTPSL